MDWKLYQNMIGKKLDRITFYEIFDPHDTYSSKDTTTFWGVIFTLEDAYYIIRVIAHDDPISLCTLAYEIIGLEEYRTAEELLLSRYEKQPGNDDGTRDKTSHPFPIVNFSYGEKIERIDFYDEPDRYYEDTAMGRSCIMRFHLEGGHKFLICDVDYMDCDWIIMVTHHRFDVAEIWKKDYEPYVILKRSLY